MFSKMQPYLKRIENLNAYISFGHQDGRDKKESQKLQALHEICGTLGDNYSLEESLSGCLRIMSNRFGMLCGVIAYNPGQFELNGDVSVFVSADGFTTKVSEPLRDTMKSVSYTQQKKIVQTDPGDFESLTDGKKDGTESLYPRQIVLPLSFGHYLIGSLSFYRMFNSPEARDTDEDLYGVLCQLISQMILLSREAWLDMALASEPRSLLLSDAPPVDKPEHMPGHSKAMLKVFRQMHQVAASESSVLILGESGVGKEMVASEIQARSNRADKPYVKINCAALPENLLESELFGHEKGAFTGALAVKKGVFEQAHSGTLLLDEIGDIPPSTQVQLLRVLQEKEIKRVGGQRSFPCDVRIIAATNKNLEDMVKKNQFRLDLFYRLNVFPIHVPPLRDRKADIIPVADYFIEKYSVRAGKKVRRITTPAIDLLISYHWPGNIRELENCIERAILLTTDEDIHSYHLPPSLQIHDRKSTPSTGTLQDTLDQVEKAMISDELLRTGGIMSKAAKNLGLTERVIGLRIRKFNLSLRDFKTRKQRPGEHEVTRC